MSHELGTLNEEESMIVTCESCKTKYRLDTARLKGLESKVRCSRCGHVFTVSQEGEEDDALIHVDLSEEPMDEEERISIPRPVSRPAIPQRPSKKGYLRKAVMLGVVLLLVGGGLFWYVTHKEDSTPSESAAPDKTSRAEKKEPIINILDATQAYFLENGRAGQIFVVEGEVANESADPVSFILLEGKLYTRDNQVAQSQRCFSGNGMSRDELTKLSVQEIQDRMMNREGKNLVNVHVPVGKRVPFMLVFHNLPELDALGDYSIEVISAKVD